MSYIVTRIDLGKAIAQVFGSTLEEASIYAEKVLNIFGFEGRVLDNILKQYEMDEEGRKMLGDRGIFYDLEDAGLLTTEREDTTLYNGKEWRIHYWLIKKNRILELAKAYDARSLVKDESPEEIYAKIPENMWEHELVME